MSNEKSNGKGKLVEEIVANSRTMTCLEDFVIKCRKENHPHYTMVKAVYDYIDYNYCRRPDTRRYSYSIKDIEMIVQEINPDFFNSS